MKIISETCSQCEKAEELVYIEENAQRESLDQVIRGVCETCVLEQGASALVFDQVDEMRPALFGPLYAHVAVFAAFVLDRIVCAWTMFSIVHVIVTREPSFFTLVTHFLFFLYHTGVFAGILFFVEDELSRAFFSAYLYPIAHSLLALAVLICTVRNTFLFVVTLVLAVIAALRLFSQTCWRSFSSTLLALFQARALTASRIVSAIVEMVHRRFHIEQTHLSRICDLEGYHEKTE